MQSFSLMKSALMFSNGKRGKRGILWILTSFAYILHIFSFLAFLLSDIVLEEFVQTKH